MQSIESEPILVVEPTWTHRSLFDFLLRKIIIGINVVSIVLALCGHPSSLSMILLVTASDFIGIQYPGMSVGFQFLVLYAVICLFCYTAGILGAVQGIYWMIGVATMYHLVAFSASIVGCRLYGLPMWASSIAASFLFLHILLLVEWKWTQKTTESVTKQEDDNGDYYCEEGTMVPYQSNGNPEMVVDHVPVPVPRLRDPSITAPDLKQQSSILETLAGKEELGEYHQEEETVLKYKQGAATKKPTFPPTNQTFLTAQYYPDDDETILKISSSQFCHAWTRC